MLTKCIEFSVIALIRPNGDVVIDRGSHHWINVDSVSQYRWWIQSPEHQMEVMNVFRSSKNYDESLESSLSRIQTEVVMTDGTILYTMFTPLGVHNRISEAYSNYEDQRTRRGYDYERRM